MTFGSFFHMPSQDGQRICEGCKAYSYCEGCRRKIEGKETHSEGHWDDLRGLVTPEGSGWLQEIDSIYITKYIDSVKSEKKNMLFFGCFF